MSAVHLSSFLPDEDVLGELLHSLSQPLTSLRCSLELSLGEAADQQQAVVDAALQQTEQVIGMIQLMREYLEAEQPGLEARRVALDRVLRKVIEDLASIAEVQGIEVRLEGTCSATVSLPESRLRLALQYLALVLMESAGRRGMVVLCLEEGSTESALRAGVSAGVHNSDPAAPIHDRMRRVKLAIAQRILEAGGMWLTIEEGDQSGFLLRIPRMLAASRAIV
jgi:hypothetical protein